MTVLERNVQIRQDLRGGGHRLDEFVGDIARIGIHEANPGNVGRGLGECLQQVRQAIPDAQIVTVVGCVLRDDDQFANAGLMQANGFRDDRLGRPAHVRALDLGDGTKGTGPATPIGDLEIGAGSLDRSSQYIALIAADCGGLIRQMIEWLRMLATAQLAHKGDDIHPTAGADDAVDARHPFNDFLAIALGHAAGGDQQLVRAFQLGQVAQSPD